MPRWTPAHPAITGTVTGFADDGAVIVALDDGSSVQAAFRATNAPSTFSEDDRVLAARSGDTWVIVDTIEAI